MCTLCISDHNNASCQTPSRNPSPALEQPSPVHKTPLLYELYDFSTLHVPSSLKQSQTMKTCSGRRSKNDEKKKIFLRPQTHGVTRKAPLWEEWMEITRLAWVSLIPWSLNYDPSIPFPPNEYFLLTLPCLSLCLASVPPFESLFRTLSLTHFSQLGSVLF